MRGEWFRRVEAGERRIVGCRRKQGQPRRRRSGFAGRRRLSERAGVRRHIGCF